MPSYNGFAEHVRSKLKEVRGFTGAILECTDEARNVALLGGGLDEVAYGYAQDMIEEAKGNLTRLEVFLNEVDLILDRGESAYYRSLRDADA